jgi:hypothetical protein
MLSIRLKDVLKYEGYSSFFDADNLKVGICGFFFRKSAKKN